MFRSAISRPGGPDCIRSIVLKHDLKRFMHFGALGLERDLKSIIFDSVYKGSRNVRFREFYARIIALGNAFPYFLERPGDHRAPRVQNVLPFLLILVTPY